MTAPNGAILFNNSTGSDTTASGLGAANVYGSGASTTSASAVVTGITTSGVQAGDLLWVQSSSGRQFSVIASVDSGTQVTCDDTFANTESSRTWAIGGKRATLDSSVELFEYNYNNGKSYDVELETDQTITTAINGTGGRGVTLRIKSDTPNTKRTITCSAQEVFKGGYIYATDLNFESTHATGYMQQSTNSGTVWHGHFYGTRCNFGNSTNNFSQFFNFSSTTYSSFSECTFDSFSSYVFYYSFPDCVKCSFVNNANYIVYYNGTAPVKGSFVSCLFNNNVGGFRWRKGWGGIVYGCIINNTGQGSTPLIDGTADAANEWKYIESNIISNCSVALSSSVENQTLLNRNAYYNNGFTEPLPNDTNGITLAADPFVDAANGDFKLNADGGSTLRANNYAINTDTSVYPFRQYVSDDFDSGAGGGATVHPLRSN
jgi:hypothetical protein